MVDGTPFHAASCPPDPQMSSRFAPFELPRWSESEDFRRLVGAFEQALPLRRASDLVQRTIVPYLVAASGLLGEVSRMFNAAAEQPIRDGSERVSLQHLEQASYGLA